MFFEIGNFGIIEQNAKNRRAFVLARADQGHRANPGMGSPSSPSAADLGRVVGRVGEHTTGASSPFAP